MKKWSILFGVWFLSAGCEKYYISVSQDKIDASYLASSHVKTPDPRQKTPPQGERLVIEWKVPETLLEENLTLCLKVIYKDYSEEIFVYPVLHRMDYIVYTLVGEAFKSKKGILTYKVDIVKENGEVFKEWKHQLFTNLIILDQPKEESIPFVEEEKFYEEDEPVEQSSSAVDADMTSSSVKDQSMQESVIEMDGFEKVERD